MDKRLVVAGVAQTPLRPAHRELRLEELIYQAASAALKDAGIERSDVDNVAMASSDQVDGRLISSMLSACPAGAYLKDEIKAADEGLFALALAAMRLRSGAFHTSLVVSWSKSSESNFTLGQNYMADPFFTRPFGHNHITAAALMAGAYLHRHRVADAPAAQVVVKNRANGARNDVLPPTKPISPEEVESSPYLSYPLRRLHVAPEFDGACALVLTTAERAPKAARPRAILREISWATDSHRLGQRDLSRFGALEIAAREAYASAGIKNPLKEIDVAEIGDHTAYHELLACEALGFCGPGKAGDLLRDGATGWDGELPVNPSGGRLSAFPVFNAGLTCAVEACLQAGGRANGRQVSGARTALAHGCMGFAGQTHCVAIFESE